MARVRAELSPDELLALGELEGLADNSVIYKDNTGILKEVALGAADTYFKSNGTTGTPTFEAVSAGGAFETTSNITSNTPGALGTDDFVFGSDSLDDDGNSAHDSRMFFDKSLGSFRAGTVYSTEWDSASIGIGSTAMGKSTTASGNYSLAMGKSTTASGGYSLAMGQSTTASQNYATAVGYSTIASGVYSTVMGYRTNANGTSSLVTGQEYIDSNNHIISVGYGTGITDTTGTAIRLEADSDQNNTKKKSIYFGQTTAPTTTTDRLYNIAGALTWNGTDLTAGGGGTPTDITVANEVTDTTCFPSFFTAATGDLGPKTNAGLSFNSATSILTATGFVGPLNGNITGDCSGNAGTVTNGVYTTDFPLNQDTTGLSATATALATARTIGGVSFDGSSNIDLPGVNTAGNQDTSGNSGTVTNGVYTTDFPLNQDTTGLSATATALATARTIGGVSFDGTANIDLPGVNTAGNQDTSGNSGTVTNGVYTTDFPLNQDTTGLSATATALATPRTINGVLFDGTANITVTADANTLSGTSLKSTILNSSLTSVGALTDLTISNAGVGTDPTISSNSANQDLNLTGNLIVSGDFTVQGTTTFIDTETLQVEDKNIEIGKVTTPTDITADGGGVTLLGNTNKTIIWDNANNNWSFNQNLNIGTGLDYKINNVSILNATTLGSSVVNSSLTSLGTLTDLTVTNTITGNISGNAGTVTNGVYTTDFPLNQDTTGLSATATKLDTARTIGGVSFDGSSNIDLPGVNTAGNQDTSGNSGTVTNGVYTTDFPLNQDTTGLSGTATALATARTIAGVSFDGTANISLNNNAITNGAGYTTNVGDVTLTGTQTLTNKTLTAPIISSISNTGTLTLPTTTGTLALTTDITGINSGTNTGDNTICTSGTATTAVTLATPRTINGVSFDGSANITVTADATTLSGTSLKSTILGSSLTSVGTLLDLTVTNTIVGDINGNAGTVTNGVYTTDFPLNQDTSGNAGTVTNGVYTTDFPLNQDTTGLSATATALATARTIGGVSFDGSSNIDLPGVNTAGNQDTSGNSGTVTNGVYTTDFPLNQDTTGLSATATKLDTARTIGGVSFDGTANIDLPGVNTSGNQDTSGNSGTVTNGVYTTDFPLNQDTTGLSGTATKLETARTINGVSFDGTENITVTADANTLTGTTLKSTVINSSLTSVGTLLDLTVTNTITGDISGNSGTVTNGVYTTDFPLNQDTTGLSATATALATARTIAGVSFDGTANISLNNNAITNGAGYTTNVGDVTLTGTQTLTNKTLTAPVISSISNTGTLTLPTTTGTLALTSNITGTNSGTNTGDEIVAIGTELDTGTDDVKYASAKAIKDSKNVPSVVPGTDGNILTSNGTDWISETPSELTVTESFVIAISDETTAITTGTAKVTFRMPYAFTVTGVRASLTTASTSGLPKFDINEGGTSILSTEITIDATELTSTTATTAPVISDSSLADDAQITIDIDTAGTGAKGAKIYLIGHQ